MSLGTILLIIVILALIGALPVWAARQQLGVRSLGPRRCRVVDFDRPVRDGAPVIAPCVDRAFHSKERT